MWLNIGDSSSGMIGGGIKTDSKILLKFGNKTGVNIDSESWTGSQIWESRSHISLSSISKKNENLPICQ